jgi:hypothetical protein
MLIAITGRMGTGKTTAFKYIERKLKKNKKNIFYLKLAAPLYEMQDTIYRIAGLNPPEAKDRELLQYLGTDWGRKISDTLWIDIFINKYKQIIEQNPDATVLCDDVRFVNEAEMVKSIGGYVLKLVGSQRGIHVRSTEHKSELEIINIDPTWVIPNIGTKKALYTQLNIFLKEGTPFGWGLK